MNVYRPHLWHYLELCTARFELNGRSVGSGTLVGPGLLVTCSHVLAETAGTVQLYVEDREVVWDLILSLDSPYPDLALLRIDRTDHQWVFLNAETRPGDALYTFGYTDDMPFGDSATVELEGWSNMRQGRNLKFKRGQVRPGMSGAPLLNLRTGSVCGIVRTTRNRGIDLGGRAVSADEVVKLLTQSSVAAAIEIDLRMTDQWAEAVRLSRTASNPPLGTRHVHGSLEAAEYFCGRQEELGLLESFWTGRESHVLALVGVGGSGKTALARQFLDNKGWLRNQEPTDNLAPLFAWSFYDYPSTSDFLQTANDYFSPKPRRRTGTGTVDRLLESLREVGSRTLIVLDGLEKMQAPGEIGGPPRGTIEDPPLRHLLLAIADGDAPQIKLIITSRFPLTDFSARPASGYRQLLLEDLSGDAASELLTRLGVKGSTEALTRDFGCHALTLDLLGRLLDEFFHGEIPSRETLPPLASATGAPGVEKQANRLSRVLTAYLHYLSQAEVALLQQVSLFRRPVEDRFLMDLISSRPGGIFVGPLGELTDHQKVAGLRRLVNLRLVTREPGKVGVGWLSCHPAVRDYFYSTIGNAEQLHSAIRERLVSLVDQPGRREEPARAQIDLLEELIYHTVMLGRREEAFQIYRERLGYLRLGWERGDHARGVSVLRLIGEGRQGSSRSSWTPEQAVRFGIDYSLYLKNLGALDEAIEVLNSMLSTELGPPRDFDIPLAERALILQNLSAILVLRGWLPEGENAARDAVGLSDELDDPRLSHDCRVRLAAALAMQGRVGPAEDEFARAAAESLTDDKVVRDVLSVRHAWLLRRLGRTDEAFRMLTEEREKYSGLQYGIIVARLGVVLAEVLADLGRVDEGLAALEEVFEWITTGSDQEMVIAGHVARARLALVAKSVSEVEDRSDRAMRLARRYGYVTYWIDAMLLEGWAKLMAGDWRSALSRAQDALHRDSIAENGMPSATDDRVRYYWGEREALELQAQALAVDSK